MSATRALELIRQLQPNAGDVKWVEPHNLHWTLNFLGDVDDTRPAGSLQHGCRSRC